ncbi:MAG: TetR/AcrR family transcriptional regulator [Acidimicrobiales bacterium]
MTTSLNPSLLAPERKGERTRAALVAAAVGRFAVDGFLRTSVADVARDIGVGPTAVYRYFPDKESLFVAAVDADAEALIDLARQAVATNYLGPMATMISRVTASITVALRDHPLAARVLAGAEPMTPERILALPALTDFRQQLTTLIHAGQAAGLVRPDVDAESLALGCETVVLYQLAHLASLLRVDREANLSDERWTGVATILDAALRPCSPPPQGRHR